MKDILFIITATLAIAFSVLAISIQFFIPTWAEPHIKRTAVIFFGAMAVWAWTVLIVFLS